MGRLYLTLFFSLGLAALANANESNGTEIVPVSDQANYRCAFEAPPNLEQYEAQVAAYMRDHKDKDDDDAVPVELITIPTWWHNIETTNGFHGVSLDQIEANMLVLNAAFESAGFVFDLVGVTTTLNSDYQSYVIEFPIFGRTPVQSEARMKTELKQGGCDTLNIYTNEPLDINTFTFLIGTATSPFFCQGADTTMDGVIVNRNAVTGGHFASLNLGKVLVHEVGHWLGLLHTFEGGCTEPNDFVLDTAMQDGPTGGFFLKADVCFEPGSVNTCPDFRDDAVRNHMNIVPDICSEEFTDGQISRMKAQYNIWRKPTPRAPSPSPSHSSSSPSCFSETATVSVLNQGPTKMADLRVGDKIPTVSGEYQPIYAFAHRDTDTVLDFLRIHTQSARALEITKDHLVFVAGQSSPVRAETIQPGDKLVLGSKREEAMVTKIDTVKRQGLYAPLTADGTLVVDGIATSCYVSLLTTAQTHQETTPTELSWISQHQLAHMMLSPIRMACLGISSSLCDANNQQNGLANFVEIGIALVDFFVKVQHGWLEMLLSALFVTIAGPLYVFECMVGPRLAAITVVLVFLGISRRFFYGRAADSTMPVKKEL